MKKTILLVFAFAIAVSLQSIYAQNFEWAKQIGGTSYDGGVSITSDALGNVYVGGFFEGIVDFDPSPGVYNLSSTGSQDIFVLKLDAFGLLVWAKQMGGTGIDGASSITADTSGNLYIIGYFHGTADFDPGPATYNLTSAGNQDVFILKLDASGNFVWAKQLCGTSNLVGSSIAIDSIGNTYVAGSFDGTVDLDPSPASLNFTSAGGTDIFIAKLDALGDLVWAKQIGGTSYDGSPSITTDVFGNVYTTGYFEGTVDFDPGAASLNFTSAGDKDVFISKLDASGSFVWAKQWGGNNRDMSVSIVTDASGNVYSAGNFEGTVDFDPGTGTYNLTSNGSEDVFISKLDASGNLLMAKQFGGNTIDNVYNIAIDASESIYTIGLFQGTADFDPGPATFNLTSTGGKDIYISKLDATGSFEWAKQFGGPSWDEGRSVTVDGYGNVYTTGFFSDTADFDPGTTTYNLASAGNLDIYIHKLSQSTNIAENKFNGRIVAFPNPTSGHFTILLEDEYPDIMLVVRNVIGQEILKKNYTSTSLIEIDVEGKTGVYFVEITAGNNRAIIQIIKE